MMYSVFLVVSLPYMYVYTYIYIHIYMYMYIYVYMYMCICVLSFPRCQPSLYDTHIYMIHTLSLTYVSLTSNTVKWHSTHNNSTAPAVVDDGNSTAHSRCDPKKEKPEMMQQAALHIVAVTQKKKKKSGGGEGLSDQ